MASRGVCPVTGAGGKWSKNKTALIAAALAVGAAAFVAIRRRNRGARAASALDALIAEHWDWRMKAYPELAACFGVAGAAAGTLDDRSLASVGRLEAHITKMLARLATIKASSMGSAARLRHELFEDQLVGVRDGLQYKAYLMCLNSLEGPQVDFAHTLEWLGTDLQAILKALRGLPTQIDQLIELLQEGVRTGMVPPATALRGVARQIEGHLNVPIRETVFFKPFEALVEASDDDDETVAVAEDVIATSILPAFERLLDFFNTTYLPAAKARTSIACSQLPNGVAMYKQCLKFHTSTDMTPEDVHKTGIIEVRRIQEKMRDVMMASSFRGNSLEEFVKFLKQDPQFVCKTADELLERYVSIVSKVEPQLPKFFGNLPAAKVTVRAMAPGQAQNAPAAYYYAGSEDGTRPGVYWANTHNLAARKTYEAETLTLHEAVPGHHLQISLAMENNELACFQRQLEDRRYSDAPGRFPLYSAYVEGWGLYSESLGYEIPGVFEDSYSQFGQLSFEMMRACRLVVDTGMHAFNWSRDMAVEYMAKHTSIDVQAIKHEIDRYITWPGQATGYKIGELKIRELRNKCEEALGSKFSVSDFHDVVLSTGSAPLSVLERQVQRYIDDNKA